MTESTDPANLSNVIGLSYTWKEKGDASSSFMPDASKVYTVTESVVPTSVSTVISTEYTEKIYDKAYALGGVVTLTRVNEADILSTVRETYKVKPDDIEDLPLQINKDTLRGFVTKTNIWEAITSNTWKDTDTVTATAYSYRSEESGKIVNYTDSFIGTDIFDTRQKAYYDTKVIEGGASRSVQVQETYFGQDANILDTFSYTYWAVVSDFANAPTVNNPDTPQDETKKSVKITENYIDMNGTSGIQDTGDNADTKFMESKYYTYYDSGKLILERFEGEKTKMVRASVEKRSTVRHPTNNRASTMTESTDPTNLSNVIGLSYTWKEKGD
ncbi:MAG: hypothetical protein AAB222_09975, partial [Candidatus Binatota bacterium]